MGRGCMLRSFSKLIDKQMIYVFSALLLAVIIALAAALIADSVVADRALKKRERNEGNRR
jgi:uncharacterized membrane protein (DUF373 family)